MFGRVEADQSQRALEVGEAFFGRSIRAKSQPLLLGERMERRVLEELRGAPFDPRMRRLRQARMELLNEARLAESGFADNQHELAFTSLCALPTARKRTELLPARHE